MRSANAHIKTQLRSSLISGHRIGARLVPCLLSATSNSTQCISSCRPPSQFSRFVLEQSFVLIVRREHSPLLLLFLSFHAVTPLFNSSASEMRALSLGLCARRSHSPLFLSLAHLLELFDVRYLSQVYSIATLVLSARLVQYIKDTPRGAVRFHGRLTTSPEHTQLIYGSEVSPILFATSPFLVRLPLAHEIYRQLRLAPSSPRRTASPHTAVDCLCPLFSPASVHFDSTKTTALLV